MLVIRNDTIHTSNLKIDGINWYAYVSNNPLKWVDPTGLTREDRLRRRAERAESNGNSDRAERLREKADESAERQRNRDNGNRDSVIGPPTWEDRYNDYAAGVKDTMSGIQDDMTPYEDIDAGSPNRVPTEDELDQYLEEWLEASDMTAAKKDEIQDLLSAFHSTLISADALERQAVLEAALSVAPTPDIGKTGYELAEFTIPELVNEYEDIAEIPRQIMESVHDYRELSAVEESKNIQLIGASKAKWGYW